MTGRLAFRVVLGIILVATVIGLGVWVYDAGVAQGIAESGRLAQAPAAAAGGYGHGLWGYGRGFWGYGPWLAPFGFLRLLFPLFWIFLIFLLIRGLFWGRRGWNGDWGRGSARLEEWHRRAHEAETPKTE